MIANFLFEIFKVISYITLGALLLSIAIFGKWWKKGNK
jgi:hypothetical protein